MTAEEIKDIVRCGETSTVQFKLLFNKVEDVANELIAFSNSNGGRIFIGINDKNGNIEGLSYKQLQNTGTLVGFKGGMKIGKKTDSDENIGMEIGKKTDSDENIGMEIGKKTDSDENIGMEIGKKSDSDENIGMEIGKKSDSDENIGMEIGKKTDSDENIGMKIGKKTDSDENTGRGTGKKEELLLKLISNNPAISISMLAKSSGMATSTVQVYLDKLRSAGKVIRVGPDKGGRWEVV